MTKAYQQGYEFANFHEQLFRKATRTVPNYELGKPRELFPNRAGAREQKFQIRQGYEFEFANFREQLTVRKATRTVPNYEFGKLRELFPNRVREQKLPNSEPCFLQGPTRAQHQN